MNANPADQVLQEVSRVLADSGIPGPVQRSAPVSGGDINRAMRVTCPGDSFFVKWNDKDIPGMFTAEAKGLSLLHESGTVRTPRVIGMREKTRDCPAFLILEWIPSHRHARQGVASEQLGHDLAALHKNTTSRFGLDHSNFIGSLTQTNEERDDWLAFYRDQRIQPMVQLAASKRLMPPRRMRMIERLIARLDQWIDSSAEPALLHGDLWSGNYMITDGDVPVLIDPAVYYGNREVELAFTELFGGFSARFYAAYNESWQLDDGYHERRDLYQLYPLLVHLNLFGETYGASVDRVLRHYV
ncbi:MAG: fructosamine kinase family protein [Chloroflexota bacterium]